MLPAQRGEANRELDRGGHRYYGWRIQDAERRRARAAGRHAADGQGVSAAVGDGEGVRPRLHINNRRAKVRAFRYGSRRVVGNFCAVGPAQDKLRTERIDQVGHVRRRIPIRVAGLRGHHLHRPNPGKRQICAVADRARSAKHGEANRQARCRRGRQAGRVQPVGVGQRREGDGLVALANLEAIGNGPRRQVIHVAGLHGDDVHLPDGGEADARGTQPLDRVPRQVSVADRQARAGRRAQVHNVRIGLVRDRRERDRLRAGVVGCQDPDALVARHQFHVLQGLQDACRRRVPAGLQDHRVGVRERQRVVAVGLRGGEVVAVLVNIALLPHVVRVGINRVGQREHVEQVIEVGFELDQVAVGERRIVTGVSAEAHNDPRQVRLVEDVAQVGQGLPHRPVIAREDIAFDPLDFLGRHPDTHQVGLHRSAQVEGERRIRAVIGEHHLRRMDADHAGIEGHRPRRGRPCAQRGRTFHHPERRRAVGDQAQQAPGARTGVGDREDVGLARIVEEDRVVDHALGRVRGLAAGDRLAVGPQHDQRRPEDRERVGHLRRRVPVGVTKLGRENGNNAIARER